jgi:hypothetical protein
MRVAVKGPSGKPDHLMQFLFDIATRVPQDSVLVIAVQHDHECPCLDGGSASACTCEVVDVAFDAPSSVKE